MLNVKNISGGYPGNSVLNDVSFTVNSGELFGILGPNGSGKTTLLKMISGLLTPEKGEVFIKGQQISSYTAKELARVAAVLPQVSSEVFAYTVKETVSLGRYAHQSGWLHSRHPDDEVLVHEAMAATGVEKFQNKLLQELSGGERQRVFLAQALAQQPEILLLDEPTNHLDLAYQKELMDQLKNWTRERGLTVVSIFHDLNLAGLYCDRLLLLNRGEVEVLGKPQIVLQEDRIRDVYQTKVVEQFHPQVPQPQVVLLPEVSGQQNSDRIIINEQFLTISEDAIELCSPIPMKVMASALVGSGFGWRNRFVNAFSAEALKKVFVEETIAMVAASKKDVFYGTYEGHGFSLFIVVAKGASIDALNTWVFINGIISDDVFIQAISAVGEANALSAVERDQGGVVIAAVQSGISVEGSQLRTMIREGVLEKIQVMDRE
ncbi:ABC transporter ATP-binding protein [Bacillus sp. FSL K6-3431]|uniref:ABC transporter ATP-binding protein n=1 Tax=Bacillus sp. FSL K6-3431 TaxID=2921500 RepID=UPI0030F56F7E